MAEEQDVGTLAPPRTAETPPAPASGGEATASSTNNQMTTDTVMSPWFERSGNPLDRDPPTDLADGHISPAYTQRHHGHSSGDHRQREIEPYANLDPWSGQASLQQV